MSNQGPTLYLGGGKGTVALPAGAAGLLQTILNAVGAILLSGAFEPLVTQEVTVAAGQKVIIIAACTSHDTTSGGGTVQAEVLVDGTIVDGGIAQTVAASGFATFPVVVETVPLAAGVHTIVLSAAQTGGGGALNLGAAAVFAVVAV